MIDSTVMTDALLVTDDLAGFSSSRFDFGAIGNGHAEIQWHACSTCTWYWTNVAPLSFCIVGIGSQRIFA
jgi:hypothetical protein